jgi:hypothetical protein
MPSKARHLDDRRIHGVNSPQLTPFCNLPIRLRLEVFGIHEQIPRATDETELFGDPERPPTPC